MRSVRYGTALCSFASKNIAPIFPNIVEFQPIKPAGDGSPHPFAGISALKIERLETADASAGLPSVSLVNGCTPEAQSSLYWWQFRLIKEMGQIEFRRFMQKNLQRGTKFHSIVHRLLKLFIANGKLPQFDEKFYEECGEVRGFIDSVIPFLSRLELHPLMCMEQKVVCRRLGYQGKFDAIIELNGKLTVVDWKTVNIYSIKSQREDASGELSLADLYSNPVQVAAYIAAVNSSQAFANFPRIEQGAIVLAYEDGRPAEVVLMDEQQIEQHFQTHLANLNFFWYAMAHYPPDITGQIRLVFNPHVADPAEAKAGG